MAYARNLVPITALTLLALTACNPAVPANNAAVAAEQNAAAAADANMASDMDDRQESNMMHDKMKMEGMGGMGNKPATNMPDSKMPATKADPMTNTQSMNTDKPMDDDMGHM